MCPPRTYGDYPIAYIMAKHADPVNPAHAGIILLARHS